MKIKEITDILEAFAPLALQESYDNSGLIVGHPADEVTGVLLAVDVDERVMDEAEAKGCNMIITHHPIVFRGMKRFNGADLTQRCVERAIRRGVALYACHTNLDAAPGGMSWRLAEMLGVGNLEVLEPKTETESGVAGFGVVGELQEEQPTIEFMQMMRKLLNVKAVRYSAIATEKVRRVAVCTGSGVDLIDAAVRSRADIYITADMKYHDFAIPDGRITVADIGHFESEYCAIQLIFDILSKKLITFAVRKSECSCNPVNYLV